MTHEPGEVRGRLAAEQQVEVIAEECVMVELDSLSMDMERVSQDASADVSDVVVGGEEGEALDTPRDDVVCRPRGRLIAKVVRHKRSPVKGAYIPRPK